MLQVQIPAIPPAKFPQITLLECPFSVHGTLTVKFVLSYGIDFRKRETQPRREENASIVHFIRTCECVTSSANNEF